MLDMEPVILAHTPYICDDCGAACTFEAMQQCARTRELCPTLKLLQQGVITDRRADDDPTFPSEFTYL